MQPGRRGVGDHARAGRPPGAAPRRRSARPRARAAPRRRARGPRGRRDGRSGPPTAPSRTGRRPSRRCCPRRARGAASAGAGSAASAWPTSAPWSSVASPMIRLGLGGQRGRDGLARRLEAEAPRATASIRSSAAAIGAEPGRATRGRWRRRGSSPAGRTAATSSSARPRARASPRRPAPGPAPRRSRPSLIAETRRPRRGSRGRPGRRAAAAGPRPGTRRRPSGTGRASRRSPRRARPAAPRRGAGAGRSALAAEQLARGVGGLLLEDLRRAQHRTRPTSPRRPRTGGRNGAGRGPGAGRASVMAGRDRARVERVPAQYWMTLVTLRPSSRSRPLRKSSSTRNARPTTSPLSRSTSSIVPAHGAAGREQVVDDEDPLAGLDGVAVDLEGVGAVLERVLDGQRLGRQLAQLADRHEARVQLVRHRRREDEPARLHAHDDVDLLVAVRLEHQVDRLLVGRGVLEQRRDVVEQDAGLREVGDLADLRAKRLGGHRGRDLRWWRARGRRRARAGEQRVASLPQPARRSSTVRERAADPSRGSPASPPRAATSDTREHRGERDPEPVGRRPASPAAVIAPATPVPSAVPRMSDSWSADEALPCSAGADPAEHDERHRRVHEAHPDARQDPGHDRDLRRHARQHDRDRQQRARGRSARSRARRTGAARSGRSAAPGATCPPVHDRSSTVNTMPVSVAGVPRHVWSSSGMYASPEKNANVITPAQEDRPPGRRPRAAASRGA